MFAKLWSWVCDKREMNLAKLWDEDCESELSLQRYWNYAWDDVELKFVKL